MMATAPRYVPAEERRRLSRQDAIRDAIKTVVEGIDLSPQAESDLWVATALGMETVLRQADEMAHAMNTAEKSESRIATHLESDYCCSAQAPCGVVILLKKRADRFRVKARAAYEALVKGRRS